MRPRLGIVVGGGPAPGINGVIAAATIRAHLSGYEVIGIQDGYEWIMTGDTSHILPLTIPDASRMHARGGSYLGISRANPTKTPETLRKTLDAFRHLRIEKLISIGGDGTGAVAQKLSEVANGSPRIVHVPKTIDNDIDLPPDVVTFGFQSARHVGVSVVQNLMADAKTTGRWYVVVTMGRQAGHLALGIGKAAGATLSLIPEEFPKPLDLKTIVDTLAGAIIKRISLGRMYGVCVVAEGLVERLVERDLAGVPGVLRDEFGHIRFSEIDFGGILKRATEVRLAELGITMTVSTKNIGYELRCADPIPFDMEYTRDLGYCAARYVIEGGDKALICIQHGHFKAIPLKDMIDPLTGRSRVRLVDLTSTWYRIARSYMVRLQPEDFHEENLPALARVLDSVPQRFRDEFAYLLDHMPIEASLEEMTLTVPPPGLLP